VTAYRRKLKPLVSFLGDVDVGNITVHDLREYVSSMMDVQTMYADHPYHDERQGKLSMHTVSGRVRAFKRLFNWLVEEGILDTNPTERIKTPRPRQREPKAIATEDFQALLDVTSGGDIADIRDHAIILTLADTGVRVGGLSGLSVGDVDFDNKLLTVCEKGSKTRLVPFGPLAAEALRAWLDVRPSGQGEALFVSLSTSKYGRVKPGGIGQILKRRAEQAKCNGPVNPHSFRHFFAREFLLNGGDLGDLSDLLGHEDVAVTKRWYGVFTIREIQKKHALYSPVANLNGGNKDDDS
jgi:integrase/recombinase XerD